MTRTTLTAALFLPAIGLSGCLDAGSEYAEVLPDERVQITFPADSSTSRSRADFAEWYLFTHGVTDSVNGMAGFVLTIVDTVARTQRPSSVDHDAHLAVWGPYADALDPVETSLWVQYAPDTDVHTWAIEQAPKNQDDASVAVAMGVVDAGATRDASTGRFEVDFDTIHAFDPTEDIEGGTFSVDYEIDGDAVRIDAAFEDFDAEQTDALYSFESADDGGGTMDLLLEVDMDGSASSQPELALVRSRWNGQGAGRSDVVISGGDLGDLVYEVSECWDTSFTAVYQSATLSDIAEEISGDPSACAFDAREEADLSR